MKYTYQIGEGQYTLEAKARKRNTYVCRCLELPQFEYTAKTEKLALQGCLNMILQALGETPVRVRHKRRSKWVKRAPKKHPWWAFWTWFRL